MIKVGLILLIILSIVISGCTSINLSKCDLKDGESVTVNLKEKLSEQICDSPGNFITKTSKLEVWKGEDGCKYIIFTSSRIHHKNPNDRSDPNTNYVENITYFDTINNPKITAIVKEQGVSGFCYGIEEKSEFKDFCTKKKFSSGEVGLSCKIIKSSDEAKFIY